MISYYQDIDLSNRKAMIDFLSNHYRYNTMNSWNESTSYANCVKVHRLGLPNDIFDKAFEMLDMEEVYDQLRFIISDWEYNYDHSWQVGFNGRSSGYLVLYKGGRKESEHKSYCTRCGQRNYKLASDIDNRCGACGAFSRVNFTKPIIETFSYPGRSVDMYEDFEDWEDSEIRERVKLVQDFDKLCDNLVSTFVSMCEGCEVEEEVIMVPKTVKVLKCAVL